MNVHAVHSVFLIGIGGIGMSALARAFRQQGAQVRGYDKTPGPVTQSLEEEGITVLYADELSQYPKDIDLVVYTPAIPADHVGLSWYRSQGYPVYKRAEVLELLTADKQVIAIAGTHGKTSITALVAHLLNQSGVSASAFIGGIASNFNSNYVHRDSPYVAVEADEFDRSFLRLHPHIAVVSALDPDHLDIYGSLEELTANFLAFTQQVAKAGCLILQAQLPLVNRVDHPKVFTYGIDTPADFQAHHIRVEAGCFLFELEIQGDDYGTCRLPFPGYHNVENALAAIAVGYALGADTPTMLKSLTTFKGIHRRFEKIIDTADAVLIDDYAHHPQEIEALLRSARTLYPGRHLTAVFQPHLYTRTRDLATPFAESLALADDVILLPIYPAREIALPGVDSKLIAGKISDIAVALVEKSALVDTLRQRSTDVVLLIGAGDIDRLVDPVKEMMHLKFAI